MSTVASRFAFVGSLKARLASIVKRDGSSSVPIRDWTGASGQPSRLQGFDQQLIWVVVALMALGLVMVYSASVALPDNPKFARYAQTHFLVRQSFAMLLGLIAALVVVQVPVAVWERQAPRIFVIALALLIAVLFFKPVKGAHRWIPLGFMNFQPSELAKVAMALYAANYMVRKMEV
ncbi:MAG: FtsW/RodA/SpoVE family cell cycle protein, partial [Rhizobacter sp.]